MTEPAPRAIIAWNHYQRWFLHGRVFRLAVQTRLLALGTAGVLCTAFGWWGLAGVFSGSDDPAVRELLKAYDSCPWRESSAAPDGAALENVVPDLTLEGGPSIGKPVANPYLEPWRRLSAPWRQLFDLRQSFTGATFLLLAAVWAAAVWGVFGGAITRSVAMHLAREEAISLGAASKYVTARWISYFSAPLFPLIGVAVVSIPALVVGWLMHASILFAGLLWPLALLIGLAATIMLAGLSVGWPMMHAAISAEGSDSFDALSRSYSYVYQRPLHLLLYAVSAAVLGFLGLIVVQLFAASVSTLAAWSVSWGSGRELMQSALDTTAAHGTVDAWGVWLIWFWRGTIGVVVLGFAFSFFWTASTAVYLLLRHDVDGVAPDEVFLDDTETFGMPPLTTDGAGVPIVPPEETITPPNHG